MKEQYKSSKKIKVRRTWGTLKPVTKVKPSKKLYKRTKTFTTWWYGHNE